jgi:cell division protein FtsI/penicillin-binding protein 2
MRTYYGSLVRKRAKVTVALFALWFIVILIRLVQLQVLEHPRLKSEVLDQNRNRITLQPQRGRILDRNGTILAVSLPVQSVFYSPHGSVAPAELRETLDRLGEVLNLSEREKAALLQRVADGHPFSWIKRKIDDETAARVSALGLKGVYLQEERERFYPQGHLAAHVLGGVDIDGNGQAGIEYQYNDILRGETGERLILRDAKRRGYHIETIRQALPGRDITLTLDAAIQYYAETELEKAVFKHGAEWGTVILSDPYTGDILAMANTPTYDPNRFPPQGGAGINRAVRYLFEPGSTFKIVSAAAAMEDHVFEPHELFDCRSGSISIGGTTIRDHKTFGVLSFPEVLIHSSNVGTALFGRRVGENRLYQTIRDFGFGEKTRSGLPAEEAGICRTPDKWHISSLSYLSIGYEISVTALQVLQAMNVFATGGYLVRPRVVRTFGDPDLDAGLVPPPVKVISAETASALTDIWIRAVDEGTGRPARLPGFSVAGKTGTAQIFDPEKRTYRSSRHRASFVGFVPAEDPVFSMVVVISEPKGDLRYGGQVAAPVFRDIAVRVLRHLRIAPHPDPRPGLISVSMAGENIP